LHKITLLSNEVKSSSTGHKILTVYRYKLHFILRKWATYRI